MIGAIFIVYKQTKIVDSILMYFLAYAVPASLHGLYDYAIMAEWGHGIHHFIDIATLILAFLLLYPIRESSSPEIHRNVIVGNKV